MFAGSQDVGATVAVQIGDAEWPTQRDAVAFRGNDENMEWQPEQRHEQREGKRSVRLSTAWDAAGSRGCHVDHRAEGNG